MGGVETRREKEGTGKEGNGKGKGWRKGEGEGRGKGREKAPLTQIPGSAPGPGAEPLVRGLGAKAPQKLNTTFHKPFSPNFDVILVKSKFL